MISVENISYKYNANGNYVLKSVFMNFKQGKLYSIVGPSGSGKSTTLSLIAGFDFPLDGCIYFEGESIRTLDLDSYHQNDISFIFQSFHLLQYLTVLENVMYPLELKNISKQEALDCAVEVLQSLGIGKDMLHRLPSELSGGEQQRVAIARAVVSTPKVILADEPTGNLDEKNKEQILDILLKLSRDRNICVIIVTHDLSIAEKSDVVYELKNGEIHKTTDRAS